MYYTDTPTGIWLVFNETRILRRHKMIFVLLIAVGSGIFFVGVYHAIKERKDKEAFKFYLVSAAAGALISVATIIVKAMIND
jgi:hypothetical membrane protein